MRLAGVDLARGLAVLGMLTAHLIARPDLVLDDPSTWIAIVDGRSSILFATIAGVSIGLVTGGSAALRGPALRIARRRLAVRAALLWLLGIALIATGVPVYVILPAYALLFLLAIPFTALGARALLVTAAAVALVMPFVQAWLDALPLWRTPAGNDLSLALGWHYPFTVWIAFVLAGLGVARAGLRRLDVQLWTLASGAALAIVGYGLHGVLRPNPVLEPFSLGNAVWTARPHSSGILEVIGSGGFALAVLAASLLLCRTVVTWIVLPLRAVGGMPLTAYAAQLVAWAIWAALVLGDTRRLTEFRALEPFWPLTAGIVIGCTAWALLVGRGPLEWVTDRIARLAVPPRDPSAGP
jgi:uncharacterized membrane protein YeiB